MKQHGQHALPRLMIARVALVVRHFVHEGVLSHCRRAEPRAAEATLPLSVPVVMILKTRQTLRRGCRSSTDRMHIAANRTVEDSEKVPFAELSITMLKPSRTNCYDQLELLLADRILVLDGAMGTMIQALHLSEADIRGELFHNYHKDLGRFSDILCLTRSADITEIHRKYLAAGADIIETNTFGASFIGMEEFQLPRELVREINTAAVRCARRAADEFNERTPNKPRFVAGSLGPTAKQMAISTRVDDTAVRGVTFDGMVDCYFEQVAALVEAGVDLLLPETVIDTLNLKACLFAIEKYFQETGRRLPVIASGTFDRGGVTFVSGQSVEAFWDAIAHVPLLAVGMNCALGPELMRPHIEELSQVATTHTSCYPNAGLPNEMGQYDLGPAAMAAMLGEWADNGWINII